MPDLAKAGKERMIFQYRVQNQLTGHSISQENIKSVPELKRKIGKMAREVYEMGKAGTNDERVRLTISIGGEI